MTVSNVLLGADAIQLVTDTLAYIDREPATMHRKVRLAPGAHVAFVVRGLVKLAWYLEAASVYWTSFESALAITSIELADIDAGFLRDGLAEVTISGWQDGPRASRLLVSHDCGGRRLVRRVDLTAGAYLAPSLGQHELPAEMTEEQLVKVAFLQQEIAVRHKLNLCVGGDVELTTIDQNSMFVRKIAEYPDKALTLERIRNSDIRVDRAAA